MFGQLETVETEKQVMDITTSCSKVVVHFAHRDFKRCRIMDGHLTVISVADLFMKR